MASILDRVLVSELRGDVVNMFLIHYAEYYDGGEFHPYKEDRSPI